MKKNIFFSFLIVLLIIVTGTYSCKNKDKKDAALANQDSLKVPPPVDTNMLRMYKAEARVICEDWIKILDKKEYKQAYIATSEYFKKTVQPEQWNQFLDALDKLGKNTSREFLAAEYFVGQQDNKQLEYIVCKFKVDFETKKGGVETVSVLREDNIWKIMGYFVN